MQIKQKLGLPSGDFIYMKNSEMIENVLDRPGIGYFVCLRKPLEDFGNVREMFKKY